MILYLDTSALVKKYVKEPGSSKVVSAWKKALCIATSAVTYAELLAAFYRKSREERMFLLS
jgi:predicted nucleic acid-binding protein